MDAVRDFFITHHIPMLLIVGGVTLLGLYVGKTMRFIRMPSVLGFMVVGVILGPSLFGVLTMETQTSLGFITDIALGFVAVSIGLELSLSELKRQGGGMVVTIFAESLLAFVVVTAAVYLLTRNLPLALILGGVAPASAPAGTVAVIQEYNARGPLTRALYSVVGFDDGLGIIIFGFSAALARALLPGSEAATELSVGAVFLEPLEEIGLSVGVGVAIAIPYSLLARAIRSDRDILPLTFGAVLVSAGLAQLFHLSLMLTDMVFGMVVVNSQRPAVINRVKNELSQQMPLLFILFFVLAGANLDVRALPALGLIGLVYLLGRSAGLIGGAYLGALVGRLGTIIRRYLGIGILSQAGVAIGLSLVVSQDFAGLGPEGRYIGSTVMTVVTATSLVFGLIGPILTKIGLQKAGEIKTTDRETSDA